MKEQPVQSSELAKVERDNVLIQLHIAEYQALTSRVSNWLVLQAGLLSLVPIYLALAVQVWSSNVIVQEVVVWLTVIGLFHVGLVWAQTLIEHYTAVRYVECYLRPLIKKIVTTDLFWGYEPHLISNRPVPAVTWEYSIPFVGLTVLVATFLVRVSQGISAWDIAGVIITFGLMIRLARLSWKAGQIRREWLTCDMEASKALQYEYDSVKAQANKTGKEPRASEVPSSSKITLENSSPTSSQPEIPQQPTQYELSSASRSNKEGKNKSNQKNQAK